LIAKAAFQKYSKEVLGVEDIKEGKDVSSMSQRRLTE
jgi:hypothetical protein